MICKTIEIRDDGTLIAALAVKLSPTCEPDRWLLERAGFGSDAMTQGEYVALWHMDGGDGPCFTDPFNWQGSRTMRAAHLWLREHFDEIESGHVICVETLLGERTTPKVSERLRW